MNYIVYVVATVSFYTVIVLLALFQKEISSVLDFMAAYAVTGYAFLIPALFYRKGVVKFGINQS